MTHSPAADNPQSNGAEAAVDSHLTQTAQSFAQPSLRGGYKAVFFDLDGTLLPMELDEFMGAYFGTLAQHMERVGIDPQAGKAGMKAGVAAMMSSDGSATNHDVFWSAFCEALGSAADPAQLEALMAPYYETDFGTIGKNVAPNPASAQAVRTLKEKGYRLVCATMPMFPRRAVEWRLSWAQVDPDAFELITTYENSRSTKPRAAYYQGILDATGLAGEEVLMVGNNTKEDGAAAQVGCDVFLVTDFLLDVDGGLDLAQTPHGSMADFARVCEALPVCR